MKSCRFSEFLARRLSKDASASLYPLPFHRTACQQEGSVSVGNVDSLVKHLHGG